MRKIKESINKEWQNKSRNNVGGKYMIIIKNICQHKNFWANFSREVNTEGEKGYKRIYI